MEMGMTPEERALRIAPEGCDGKHPKGGCLFEQVRDTIYDSERIAHRDTVDECICIVRNLIDSDGTITWNAAIWRAVEALQEHRVAFRE